MHVPIAGMSLAAGDRPALPDALPLILTPVPIAFLELVIDPACSIAFEAEERGIMERLPRRVDAPMFSRRMVTVGLVQGVIVLITVLAVSLWGVFGACGPCRSPHSW